MESFIALKPKDVKILKESTQKVLDLSEESEELTEEDVVEYMELADFFQDVADDIKQKVKDITGYESEDDIEEAEEAKEAEEDNILS
jgi:two-component sensor histidine kinase